MQEYVNEGHGSSPEHLSSFTFRSRSFTFRLRSRPVSRACHRLSTPVSLPFQSLDKRLCKNALWLQRQLVRGGGGLPVLGKTHSAQHQFWARHLKTKHPLHPFIGCLIDFCVAPHVHAYAWIGHVYHAPVAQI